MAIAIELGLKAYLLQFGISDDWNRVHLGHDLTKTVRCVRRAGFADLPDGIDELAQVLGPLYASGALSRDLVNPSFPMRQDIADRAISALLTAVETLLRRKASESG